MINKTKVFSLPDPTVPLSEKKKDEYGLMFGKYISQEWSTLNSTFFRTRYDKISVNRSYASGQQSASKYRQLINDAADTSWMALDYDIISVVPKYVRLITDYIMGLPEKAKAVAVDPLSTTEREEYKNELIFRKENKKLIKEIEEATGEKMLEDDFIPEGEDDIKVYMATKFKQAVEIAMTQGVKLVFELNDYPDEIKRQIIEDVVVDGYAGTKTWTDPQYGIQVRRVDPLYAVYPSSKTRDLSDIEYGGEIYKMSIYELKRILSGKYTDKQWRDIATKYAGRGNTYNINGSNGSIDAYTGEQVMDWEETKVDVLDFAFKTPCKRKYVETKTKYGNDGFFPKKDTYENKEGEKIEEFDYETVFTGMHIMDTEIIFNYQQLFNVSHYQNDLQKAELPYKFYMPSHYRMNNRSYVDFMRVPADRMMTSALKLQQMVNQAKPTGLSINISGLDAISMGDGGTLSPLEVKDIYDATGVVYYRSTDESGNFVDNSPIRPLPNVIQNVPELVSVYNFYLDQIRNMTGITPEMEGVIGNRQAYKTVESSINSATSAISDVAHAYKRITQRTAQHICSALQDIVEHGKGTNVYKMYKEALGSSDLNIIDALDNISTRSFGISIEIDTEMKEYMELEQSIQTALAARTIELPDVMAVRKYAKVDINMASELLEIRIKQNAKRLQEMELQRIQAQNQAIMQQQQQGAMIKQMEMKMELELYQQKAMIDIEKEKQLEMIKAGIKSQLSTQDFYEDLELKDMEVEGKAIDQAQKNQHSFEKIAFQAEKQKELIDKRENNKQKQNTSVTDVM